MRRLIKSRNYLKKYLGFLLILGFISLGAIGGCNNNGGSDSIGSGPGFVTPLGIAVEADGSLVVVDDGLEAVVRVDPVTGDRTILSDAGTGTGPDFVSLRGLAVEADGRLVVVDSVLDALIRVDPVTGDRTILSGGNTSIEDPSTVPELFELASNYPNPFSSSTTFSFTLSQPEFVQLSIYDILGRHVATLADGRYSARQHTVSWEAASHASGVYVARMQVGSNVQSLRMLLVR